MPDEPVLTTQNRPPLFGIHAGNIPASYCIVYQKANILFILTFIVILPSGTDFSCMKIPACLVK